MKKKSKIILSTLSAISIGALVIGSSLACVQYNSNKKDDNLTKTNNKQVDNLATNSNSQVNNSITYNDHAYLQTLNQSITTNPQGSSWTKKDALQYTNTKINDMVHLYGVSTILRWILIQNLNYSLIQYLKSILQQQFSISIFNFNYAITNATNNNNLTNYRCTITLNVEFKVTSKADNATLTFNNTYTYDNVALAPAVINNGQDAYAYLILANSLANTLIPSKASYCNNAHISSNWTNNDFTNLQAIDWLPISPSNVITTSNYQGALADGCARSLNSGMNQSYTQQAQFISLISQEQLYTFNIGFKFGQLNDLVIEVEGQSSNNDNLYTFNYNDQVTLTVNFTDSTIIRGVNNIIYQWVKANPSNSNPGMTIANEIKPTYKFNCYKSYRYYLQVTLPDGTTLTSNSITINVNTSSLSIINSNSDANANSSIYDAQYGTKVTLSANQAWQNVSGVKYTWEAYNNISKKFEPIQNAPNAYSYTFTATTNEVFKLVITTKNGEFTTTSINSYTINIKNNSITIAAQNNKGTPYQNAQQIPYGSYVQLVLNDASAWEKISGLRYTWSKIVNSTPIESVQSTSQYLPFSINTLTSNVSYQLQISNPTNSSFAPLTTSINLGVANTQLIIATNPAPGANSYITQGANGSINVVYGHQVTLQITSSYWENLKNPNYKYQWCKYVQNSTNGTWSFQPIAIGKTYTPTINNLGGTYRLQISDPSNTDFALNPSNSITIIVTEKNCTIQPSIANYTNYINYGSSLTLSLPSDSYWSTNNQNLIYTWYKQGDSTALGIGTSFTLTDAKSSNSGTYYLVITNKNNPDFSITSNLILVNVGTPKLTIGLKNASQSSNSYQLQDTYQCDYGQQVTLKIDDINSSNAIINSANQFQWQWGVMNDNSFTEIGETNFGSYASLSKYALFLSDLYPSQAKTGITYRLVMKGDIGASQVTSNTITILPNASSSYLQLQVVNQNYNPNQNYQITYGNNATVSPYGYWSNENKPSNISLSYQWTNANDKPMGTEDSLPINYLIANQTYQLTITCHGIPGFKLTSTITLAPKSNIITINVKNTYGDINNDNLTQGSLTATYGSYIYLNVLNLNVYDLYDSFQYNWEYAVYTNGQVKWKSINPNNSHNFDYYAFIAMQNVQLKLVITSKKPGFTLISTPLSVSVVNHTISINVYKGKNNWTANPSDTNLLPNTGGNNYFLNYAHEYTLGLSDYWNNPNTNVTDGFNEIYENGLTYTWKVRGQAQAIQTVSTTDATFNPWYSINSFATSSIYTLTISGKIKSSLPNNLPQPENISTFKSLDLTTTIILNVQSNTISIGAVTKPNGPVSMVNGGTYNVVYGYTPSIQVQTKYFTQNKSDYTFEWYLNDNSTPYKSAVGLTEITLPTPILSSGTNVQLVILPLQGGKSISSQIITLNPINLNVNISGYAGENNSANRSSTQVVANYSENTYLTPTPSTSSNFNFWASSDASKYFSGLKYTWYEVAGDGSLLPITNNDSANTQTLLLNPTQDELQYTLVITDPNISSSFKITSTTNITIKVINSSIQIQASDENPKYGDAVTLSLKTPYWTNVSHQWYYNSVASGNEVPNNGINGNTGTSPSYEFYAEKSNTYVLQITWTENGKQFQLTSNSISINVQDAVLPLTGTGTNPDGSSISFPSLNVLNEYSLSCWYGAHDLSFSPTGYWATVDATPHWQTWNATDGWKNITGATSKTYKLAYALVQNATYRLVLTYNGLKITSGAIVLHLINQNVSIAATYNGKISTSTSDPISIPFGAKFTLSATGAWASSNISSSYTYTWYYGTNDKNGVKIGTGVSITVLGNSVTTYDGSALPTSNSTYSYYCVIKNANWNQNNSSINGVSATTTPTVNIIDVTPQFSVQEMTAGSLNTLAPEDHTNYQYLTNYGTQIKLNINNYGANATSWNWNFGSINHCSWYVEVNGKSYQVNQNNLPNFSFYSLTNGAQYYAVISGSLSNGMTFSVTSPLLTFSLQQTSLALSITSGSTNAAGDSNSIVSGKDTAYVVKYGSMQIITPSTYWINYFNNNSNLKPTYTWTYNDGNGTWTSINNNLNTSTNQYQYAQFFTNGMDNGAKEGAYQLKVQYSSISQVIPNGSTSQTVHFTIATEQPVIVEIVGGTLGISTSGKDVTLDSGNTYSCLYGSLANLVINQNQIDWNSPTFLQNNNPMVPTGYSNLKITYNWYYGATGNNLSLTSISTSDYAINGQAGFYQLVIAATSNNASIFTLSSNIVQVKVSENTIAIADDSGQVRGIYSVSLGQCLPLQLDPTNYWAKNSSGNSYQWYCSTSSTFNESNVYNAKNNPTGTIYPLNVNPISIPQNSASATYNIYFDQDDDEDVYEPTYTTPIFYGPNNLNLYGSKDGQSIKCTSCITVQTKIYYWIKLTNSNWASGTPALISNPILINPTNDTVTIGSYSNTFSSSGSSWYNSSNNYTYDYGDKVTMAVVSDKTDLPSGVTYNWQVYTGATTYWLENPNQIVNDEINKIGNNPTNPVSFSIPNVYFGDGYFDIIPGTSTSPTGDYDTSPNQTSYWLHVLQGGTYRLKVTINNVSIYSAPIHIGVNSNTTTIALQATAVNFNQDNLMSDKSISNQSQISVPYGRNATVQLVPPSDDQTVQFWLNVFNNAYGTSGLFSRDFYKWTIYWTNTVSNISTTLGPASESYSSSFQLDTTGSASDWTLSSSLGISNTSTESLLWNMGTITLPQVLSSYTFYLTITPNQKAPLTQYVPYQTYYRPNSNFTGNSGSAFDTFNPTPAPFKITSNTTQVNAAGNYVGLEGKTDTVYTLGNNTSTTSYSSTSVNVPYLANYELQIPSITGSSQTSQELSNWWWLHEIANGGMVDGKKVYEISLYTVESSITPNIGYSYSIISTVPIEQISDFIANKTSSWNSPAITENKTYAIQVNVLNPSGKVIGTFYSSILTVTCFANGNNISITPVGISTTSNPSTYSMSYLQLINNPIEFQVSNNWSYLKGLSSITKIKILLYQVGNNSPISVVSGDWDPASALSTWTNPYAPIYEAGQYYAEVQFYNGSTLVQSIKQTNPININTTFSSATKNNADSDFTINSTVSQQSSNFDTSITNENDAYSYNFNSFVNWQTSTFASNATTDTSNTNPYALTTTITDSELGNAAYYGQYFVNTSGTKLSIPQDSATALYSAINFAIQYQASGSSTWNTYGKAVTFDPNLLPSGTNYWGIITNYWLMQNASKTNQLSTGINGFNPFAWTLGNQNYHWRVQAQVELTYDGTNYSYHAPSTISTNLANQFVFTSPSWQFKENTNSLSLEITNSSGTAISPRTSTDTSIYSLNLSDKYNFAFDSTPNVSWNAPISDEQINPYSDTATMYLMNPILLNVQIMHENLGDNSFSATSDSWTNPNASISSPYAIYQTLFNNWKNNSLTNYSLKDVLNHLTSLSLITGFYKVQFTLLNASNTWIMNAQNGIDSTKWTFNTIDTITFSTEPIYIFANNSTTANIAMNKMNNDINLNWQDASTARAK